MNNVHTPPLRVSATASQPESLDLRHYLTVLKRVKWRLFGTSLVVTLIAAMVVFLITPIYRATTTVLIESEDANVLSIQEVYGMDSKSKEYYLTQFEIIRSRPIAERVVRDNALDQYKEYAPTANRFSLAKMLPEWLPGPLQNSTPPDRFGSQVRTYLQNLTVSPVNSTQLVNIHIESTDPVLAARLSNAHAGAYIESTLEAKLAITQSAAEWMSSRLEGLRRNLEESERRLQDFRERERIVDAGGVTALPEREINEITTRLVEARRQLSQSRSNYMQTRGVNEVDPRQLDSVPAVIRDPLVLDRRNELAAAEQRVAELSKRYGARHPRMIGAKSDLASAQDSLARAVARVIDGIRQEYDVAQAQVRELEAAVETARAKYLATGRKEGELLELQREVETSRQLYELFYNRIRETSETGDLATASARVVSPAVAPAEPAKPHKELVILLAFVASSMLGALIAFIADALNNVIRDPQDFDERLGEPLLAIVPLIKAKKTSLNPSLAYFDDKEPRFREAIRTVRTGIALSMLDNPKQVIMVTSSLPGDGKSTIAANIAHAFGQVGKTLLVDCDMRRPSLAKVYAVPGQRSGLAELIAGSASLDDVIQERIDENIHFISAGSIPQNPLEMLVSNRFAEALAEVSALYDHVILDCPPTLPVSDATVLGSLADTIVYVVKAGSTNTRQVQQGLKTLRAANGHVTGCILNAVDFEKAARYDQEYGYYESYA